MAERLLKLPGFLYKLDNGCYYLGKWICRKCTDTEAADCLAMYEICRAGKEEPDTDMYFQKIRAFADFALEVPYNAAKIKEDMIALAHALSVQEQEKLETQISRFEEDLQKYCRNA